MGFWDYWLPGSSSHHPRMTAFAALILALIESWWVLGAKIRCIVCANFFMVSSGMSTLGTIFPLPPYLPSDPIPKESKPLCDIGNLIFSFRERQSHGTEEFLKFLFFGVGFGLCSVA